MIWPIIKPIEPHFIPILLSSGTNSKSSHEWRSWAFAAAAVHTTVFCKIGLPEIKIEFIRVHGLKYKLDRQVTNHALAIFYNNPSKDKRRASNFENHRVKVRFTALDKRYTDFL